MEEVYDNTFKRQVCFKLETEMEDKQFWLSEAVKHYLPIGSIVSIKRGKGIWKDLEVTCIDKAHMAGYVRVKSKRGIYHSVHYLDVKSIVELKETK